MVIFVKSRLGKYLQWAIEAFKITSGGVKDEVQIHTHISYSRSAFKYPNEIGSGVYDIHSPHILSGSKIVTLLKKAKSVIPVGQLWVNRECGLKTSSWKEVDGSKLEMVYTTKEF